MANILTAMATIIEDANRSVREVLQGNNRANNMGDGLENYLKLAFSDALKTENKAERIKKISATFSYTGAKNNPPDLILKGSDAIEIKKIESRTSNLHLNSSHPKATLTSNNPRITQACRNCETWQHKDIIYAVGHVKNQQLNALWMVYGDCYCADNDTYEQVEQRIKTSINTLGLTNNQTTNKLGGVSSIDPLDISYLRVRGMWMIKNPCKVFDYLHQTDKTAAFELVVIMTQKKYDAFPQIDKTRLKTINNLAIKTVKIQNPNNPAHLIAGKLLTFTR